MRMSESTPQKPQMRRILVAVDASPHSLAALDAALRLAADLEAEIIGLFVEDINLLRLAGMPFASEVRTSSAATHDLSSQGMEAGMRAQAARARRAFNRATAEARVKAQFRVVRGQVALEILQAAGDADLLTLGRVSRPLTPRMILGSTARAALRLPGSVLFSARPPRDGEVVMVCFGAGPRSMRALETAAALAAPAGTLIVLFIAPDDATAEAQRQQVLPWMTQRQLSFTARRTPAASSTNLVNAAQVEGCSVLVVEGDTIVDGEQTLQTLLQETDCSLMIVR
jgi:nucleotide-binding universal stress UspA family protein